MDRSTRRWVVAVVTTLTLSGCGGNKDDQGAPSPSPSASANFSPSPMPSAFPSASGPIPETGAVKAAFAPIRGYSYAVAPADLETDIAADADPESYAVRGFGARTVRQGSVPVAVVRVYEFRGDSANPEGLLDGFIKYYLKDAKAEPRSAWVGSTYTYHFVGKWGPTVLFYSSVTLAVIVTGEDQRAVSRVARALIVAS